MFDAYDDWQKDDFLARYRVPVESADLVKELTQRIIQTSWGGFGGKLDEITIATGIEMASKYDGIQLRREYIYQKTDISVEGVVLPERPKPLHCMDTFDSDGNKTNRAVYLDCNIKPHLTLLEIKLSEAIAQRDVAQDDRDSYKNACSANREELVSTLLRAENAEAALATEKALSTELRNALVLARLQHPEPDYDTTVAERSVNL